MSRDSGGRSPNLKICFQSTMIQSMTMAPPQIDVVQGVTLAKPQTTTASS